MQVQEVINICKKYYNEKQFAHAERVANYISEMEYIINDDELFKLCRQLAFAHDLIEDTDCSYSEFEEDLDLKIGLAYITCSAPNFYEDYIHAIKNIAIRGDFVGRAVWFVKLADMADHLNLKDTLTDKLKVKYLNALSILL